MSDEQIHVFSKLVNAYVRAEIQFSDIKLGITPTPNPHSARALSYANKTRHYCRTKLFEFVTTLV